MSIYKIMALVFSTITFYQATAQKEKTDPTITKSGNEFFANLLEQKVDTIVTYNYPDYRSEPWEHAYILWKKDGKTSLYIDRSKETQILNEETAAGVWRFLDTNLATIKKEKVKPFSAMIKVKGKNVVETIPTMDSQWWRCWIYLKGETIKISEGESHFEKKSTDSNGKVKMNINYEYNMKLKMKLFLDMLDEMVDL